MSFGPRPRFLPDLEAGVRRQRPACAARKIGDIQSLDGKLQVIRRSLRRGAAEEQAVVLRRVAGEDHDARQPLQHGGNDIQGRAVAVPDPEPARARREIHERNPQVLLELVSDLETIDLPGSRAAPDSLFVPVGDLRAALEVLLRHRQNAGLGVRILQIGLEIDIGRLALGVLLSPDDSRRKFFRRDVLPDDARHTDAGDFQGFPAVEPDAQLDVPVGGLRIHEPEIPKHEFFVRIEDVRSRLQVNPLPSVRARQDVDSAAKVLGSGLDLDFVAHGVPLTEVANELLVLAGNNSGIDDRDGDTRFLLPAPFHNQDIGNRAARIVDQPEILEPGQRPGEDRGRKRDARETLPGEARFRRIKRNPVAPDRGVEVRRGRRDERRAKHHDEGEAPHRKSYASWASAARPKIRSLKRWYRNATTSSRTPSPMTDRIL